MRRPLRPCLIPKLVAGPHEPMPDALPKPDATLVRGCSAAVWSIPTRGTMAIAHHFLADSNARDHQRHRSRW